MKKDPSIKDVLGDHIFYKYIEAKQKEWDGYKTMVSRWELDQYLVTY